MNKTLKWILLAVIIFISVVVIDKNLNGVENPEGENNIKIINLGFVIIFIIVAISVIILKYSRKGKD